MARPRKSNSDLRLSGTYRKHRHDAAAPAAGAMPAPPGWMDGVALAYWHDLAPLLAGTCTDLDAGVLALHCQSYAVWCRASEIVAEDGPVTESPSGQLVPHPATKVADVAAKVVIRTGCELGLTPRSRGAKPSPPTRRKPSALDDIINHERPGA